MLDDSTPPLFFRDGTYRSRDAKRGNQVRLGFGTWIQIAENLLILLDIAGMRSNGFAFEFCVRIYIPYRVNLQAQPCENTINRELPWQLIASSGIAATLLNGGQTANLAFLMPLDIR
ncbi:hypothetical protein TNCV_1976291 [Trichonephila clavipes]|nr:hypothetical protein TNCV_1976291 [Trichonephila clavipes]